MTFLNILQVAWQGLTANKMRSFLTTLGIIIGVVAVIMMLAISAGTEAVIAEQIEGLGANLIIINPRRGQPGAGRQFVYDDAVAIQQEIANIRGVSAEMPTASMIVKSDYTSLELGVMGVTPDYPDVREAPLAEGRFFNEEELERKAKVAVLGYDIAQELFGDRVALGQEIKIGTTRFKVIGVMAQKGTVGDMDYDGQISIPITVVHQKYAISQMMVNRMRTLYVEVDSQENMDKVTQQISNLLAKRHGVSLADPDFFVETQQDIIKTKQATTAAFRSLLAWVAGVSLFVGGIGIMNIMLVSVTERTREIGIRQSVGATPSDVRLQFLTEAVALSLVGGLVGVAGGVGGSILINIAGEMRTVIVPVSIPMAFGSAAAVGIFFGYFPANKAAQLDPIEALRHE